MRSGPYPRVCPGRQVARSPHTSGMPSVVIEAGLAGVPTVATAVGLFRRAAWSGTGLYAVVGWFALVPVSVAAMAIVMLVNDDPHAATSDAVVLTVAAAGFALVTWLLYRKLFARPSPAAWRRKQKKGEVSRTWS